MVLPPPEVVMSVPPKTFKTLAAGVATPESVTNVVGTDGAEERPKTPSWLIDPSPNLSKVYFAYKCLRNTKFIRNFFL